MLHSETCLDWLFLIVIKMSQMTYPLPNGTRKLSLLLAAALFTGVVPVSLYSLVPCLVTSCSDVVMYECHWPPPAGCGPPCRFGPCRGRWPPRCHTVRRSSGPLRWPSDSPDLCAHRHSLYWQQGCIDCRSLSLCHILCTEAEQLFCWLFNPTHYLPCASIPPPPHVSYVIRPH